MDYLAYTSLKSAREDIYNDQLPEDAYELEHRRSDYKGTEYW